MGAFVYRCDPKNTTITHFSRLFNSLSYVAGVGIAIIFIYTLTTDCECDFDTFKGKNTSQATSPVFLIVMIVLTCFTAFVVCVVNILLPPNAQIYQTTHSEYSHSMYNTHTGQTIDMYNVTTTTHNQVDDIKPLSKKLTRHNLHNFATYLLIFVPIIVMTFYLLKVANTGCKDCCVKYAYNDDVCEVKTTKYYGDASAWESFAFEKNKTIHNTPF